MDFLRFSRKCQIEKSTQLSISRKCRKTLQLIEISRFQFAVHHDYNVDVFDFDCIFDLYLNLPPPHDLLYLVSQVGTHAELQRLKVLAHRCAHYLVLH